MGKSRRPEKDRQINSKRTLPLNNKLDIKPVLEGVLLSCAIAFLFYKSFFGCLVGVVVVPFWYKYRQEEQREKDRAKLLIEFKEFMMLIVAGLQTGYSLERAFKQAEIELKRLYPKDSVLAESVHRMNQKISMNTQLEKAFLEFANTLNIEEAISLADIISFAKRSGGDYGKNIRQTAMKIEEALAVKQEIETITTEKRLELKVMCVMPMGILAYITLTSSSFVAPLYGNVIGAVLMTVCLIIYGFLIILGRRIISINV